MGRRAKFFTVAEKRHAERARRLLYQQTPNYKDLRVRQNQRAYVRRKETSRPAADDGFVSDFQLPTLPTRLTTLASLPLPTSRLFWRLASSAQDSESPYDDSLLKQWDGYPPVGENTIEDREQLMDALSGYRLRVRGEHETSRIQRCKTTPTRQFTLQVQTELSDSLADYDALARQLDDQAKESAETEMGEHLLEWKAYLVQGLYEDVEALGHGSGVFTNLYLERCYKYKWF